MAPLVGVEGEVRGGACAGTAVGWVMVEGGGSVAAGTVGAVGGFASEFEGGAGGGCWCLLGRFGAGRDGVSGVGGFVGGQCCSFALDVGFEGVGDVGEDLALFFRQVGF